MRFVKCTVLFFVVLLSFGSAYAAPDLGFYKGKVVNYIVATKPGGGYDMYGRLIGKYMQKYLPGSTVIIKNVPGAGHIIGANETYLAKPDGLTIGTFNTALIYSQIIGQSGIKFDLVKFSWIGKANTEERVLIIDKRSPIRNYTALAGSKTPVKMVSSGVGAANHQETLLAAEALNLPLKVIPGYMGREGEMAMLRGEVDGQIGSYISLKPFIVAEGCHVVLQFGAKKHPELPNVPLALEQKASPRGKKLVALMANMASIWRPTAAPPGVPAGRLEALREAYKKALSDPALLKEAERAGMDLEAGFGDDVARMVKDAVLQPPENVEVLKKIIKVD